MAKADIWMKLYIGDYLADTQALSTEEHGAYLLLLMSYYRTGPLPNDAKKLSQVARAATKKWSSISAVVMPFFFIADDGLWHHKRADDEIEKNRISSENNRDKAMKAAEKRWNSHAPSNAPSMDESNLKSNKIPGFSDAPSMVSQKLEVRSYKEQVQVQEQKPRSKLDSEFFLPEWIDRESWEGFEEMRKKSRNPLTARARVLAIKELIKLESMGHPAEDVLNQSTLKGWKGLFPISSTNGGNNNARPTAADTSIEAKKTWFKRHAAQHVADGADYPGRTIEAGSTGSEPRGTGSANGALFGTSR